MQFKNLLWSHLGSSNIPYSHFLKYCAVPMISSGVILGGRHCWISKETHIVSLSMQWYNNWTMMTICLRCCWPSKSPNHFWPTEPRTLITPRRLQQIVKVSLCRSVILMKDVAVFGGNHPTESMCCCRPGGTWIPEHGVSQHNISQRVMPHHQSCPTTSLTPSHGAKNMWLSRSGGLPLLKGTVQTFSCPL